MSAIAAMWQTDRSRLITLAGTAVGVFWIVLNLDFFTRPGTSNVLEGLAQHGFVLGWMLLLTSRSRTVSPGTLGIFWLLGVWGVYLLIYVVEDAAGSAYGAKAADRSVPEWIGPAVEELLKVAPVALYMFFAGRSGYRHPSITDGMLLGFALGAGMAFQEDAQAGKILLSGDGWGAATPWSTILPTISPVGRAFALNHALWAALSGLGVGAALMFRQVRFAWLFAAAGVLLSLTNHMLVNHFVDTVGNALQAVGRARVTEPFGTIQSLSDNGRVPMLVLIAGAVAAVVAEQMIQRWVSKRDSMFPPLPRERISQLLGNAGSREGLSALLAADRYMCLRRSLYYAGWQTSRSGGYPGVTDADYAELVALAVRLQVFSPPGEPEAPAPLVASPAPVDLPPSG